MEGEQECIPCAAYLLSDGSVSPITLFYPNDKYNLLAKLANTHPEFPPAVALSNSELWKGLAGVPALRIWAKQISGGAVQQFSGGMLTPSIAITVDKGFLIPGSQYSALICNLEELNLPPIPTTEFQTPSTTFHLPTILDPPYFDYRTEFPGLWTGLPPKLKGASNELRFMSLPVTSTRFAIPSARFEGKFMVAAGYGGESNSPNELEEFIETYHPELIDKPTAVKQQATAPSFVQVQKLFSRVINRLVVAPGQYLNTLFQGSIFCINASLSVGHCGSLLYDLQDPSLFYGVFCGSFRNPVVDATTKASIVLNKVDNYVWSTIDPVFVNCWIRYALPYFLSDACSSHKNLVAIVDYLEQVSDIAVTLGLPEALTKAREKLASIPS